MKPRVLRLWSFSGKNGSSSGALVLAALVLLASGPARADCVTPAGVAGDMVYNTDSSVMQFCDGANWIGMAGGSASPGGGGGSGITALTGDISASGSGSVAASIVTGAVTYAKIQNTTAASVLLGRGAGSGAGTLQEITLGSGLSLSGTTLSATGGLSGAGATGYVPYWSGASALSYDNTAGGQFFWDSTNHRLGVGTAAPTSSLQVANGNICATNAAGSVSFFCATNSASNGQIFLQSSSGSGHTVHIDTNGNTYFNGGNVGIGTTAPAGALHVLASAGQANVTGAGVFIGKSLGDDYQIQLTNPSGGVPHIDFANDAASDYDMRLMLYADDALVVDGGDVVFGGRIGIGGVGPSYPIHTAAGAYVTTAGVWTNASDARLKEDVAPLAYGLDAVLKLAPVSYTFKADGSHQIGFIAQDVRKVMPELVTGREGDVAKGETLGLSYGQMTAAIVNAVKELKGLFDSHDAEIKALRTENAALKVRLDDMDARLKALSVSVPATVH